MSDLSRFAVNQSLASPLIDVTTAKPVTDDERSEDSSYSVKQYDRLIRRLETINSLERASASPLCVPRVERVETFGVSWGVPAHEDLMR